MGSPERVVVIGAGAGGMLAAGRAAAVGARVTLLEKTDGPGKKLLLTGQGRCNLTNTRSLDEFIMAFGSNGRFLYSALHAFFHDELLALLARYGLTTKMEGWRVFPASDDAHDVVAALRRYLAEGRVELRACAGVSGIIAEEGRIAGVRLAQEVLPAAAVVLATGGASYPGTGSSGDGYRLAAALGHAIVPLRPALVPLAVAEQAFAQRLQGASLDGVRLTSFRGPAGEIDPSLVPPQDVGRGIPGKQAHPPVIESRTGDLLFTHYGLSGPVVLDMSLAVMDALAQGPVSVAVDLVPGLTLTELRRKLQAELDLHGRRSLAHILSGLAPPKMAEPLLALAELPPDKPGHQVSATERNRLALLLKALRFNIQAPLPLAAATVTAGGVALPEIDPRTMASKLVRGLYFAGEVMDVDGLSGGYNLQAAFSTGYLAGESAAGYVKSLAGG